MKIEIRLDERDPPGGEVRLVGDDGQQPVAAPFVGWLGLLRALEEAVARAG